MEELIKLLGLVTEDKKADAQKLVDTVKAKITALDTEVSTQERQKIDAISSRDEFKAKIKEVGTKLGIDINTESVTDAIDVIKSKTGIKETEALEIKDREIEQLKTEITTLNTNYTELQNTSKEETLNVILERDLALVLPKYKAVEELSSYMIQDIKKLAHFENGKLVFKNEDGTTVRIDGADATLDNMVAQKKALEVANKKGVFFDISVQNSGAGNGGGKQQQDDFIP